MVNHLEIPEPVQLLFFAILVSFIVLVIEPPTINYITPPISAFSNVNKTVQVTVQQPDNITKLVYQYGGITNTSKYTGIDKRDIFLKLRASKVFNLQCTWFSQAPNDTTYINAMYCSVLQEKFFYMDSPYNDFEYMSDFTKNYCQVNICRYSNLVMLLS